MQCAACHHSFDVENESRLLPAVCPACGSKVGSVAVAVATAEPVDVEPVSFEQAEPNEVAASSAEPVEAAPIKPAKAKGGGARRALNDLLLSLFFVGAIVIAVMSALVAMWAMKQRDAFKDQAVQGTKAVNAMVDAAANSSRLKGPANAQARQEIFAPAIDYYKAIGDELRKDPESLDRAAEAYQRSAALQAKSGKSALAFDLLSAADLFDKMMKAEYEPSRYPSLKQNALSITTPMEWAMVKDTPMAAHAFGLMQSFGMTEASLRSLADKHPTSPAFRDDLATILTYSGTLQTAVPDRHSFAMQAWVEARDLLETLAREQPGNVEYQTRLAQALTSLANLQKQHDQKDDAIANLKRAVEVREQLTQSNPEDKELASELTKVKNDLAKLESAG